MMHSNKRLVVINVDNEINEINKTCENYEPSDEENTA